MNRHARNVILSALAAAALAPATVTTAQEADEALTPRAKYCTAEPVALDTLLALRAAGAATPAAGEAGAEAEAGPLAGVEEIALTEIPAGEAADEATAQAIADLELIYASCYNEGAFLQAAALLSERGQRALAELATDPAVAARFATPAPFRRDQRIPGIAVDTVQVFPDGTAGAIVTWAPGDPRQEVNLHLYVKGDDGLWYLDREIAVAAEDGDTSAAAATPEA
ncbi:MAG: hypothetical protein ACKOWF_16155 [Chloroflexota bacterium]